MVSLLGFIGLIGFIGLGSGARGLPTFFDKNMHFIVLRCHFIMFLTILSHICQQRDSVFAQHTASR